MKVGLLHKERIQTEVMNKRVLRGIFLPQKGAVKLG